jgi:hypothetical protein
MRNIYHQSLLLMVNGIDPLPGQIRFRMKVADGASRARLGVTYRVSPDPKPDRSSQR